MSRHLIDQPLFDPDQLALLREALGEDDLRAMLSEVPGAAGQALCGINAALECNDLTEARRLAHRFKGVASSFGAARLAVIAFELELESISIASMRELLPALADAVDDTLAALPGVGCVPLPGAKP